jgi:hypothetical protein
MFDQELPPWTNNLDHIRLNRHMKTKFSATSVDQTLDSNMLILVSPKPIPHSQLLSQSQNNETISS